MRRFAPWIAAVVVVVGGALAAGIATWPWTPRTELVGPTGPPPAPDAPPAFSGDRPNVVVVIGCTVRRDQVSPYGGLPGTTPFLSEVSEHGVRFTGALSAAPWTRPAATAIVTGQPFRSIGMADPAHAYNRKLLAPAVTTLAEILKSAGYFTIGATTNPNLNRVFGFDQGFDRYYEATDIWRVGTKKVPGVQVVDRLLPTLDGREPRDAPVYLQMTLLDAHQPSQLPAHAVEAFADPTVPGRVQVYRAMLHRFDIAVRKLWNGLHARGFDDSNTVFVVVSDHGEGMEWPKNQGKGHGNFMVPTVLDMTWLVRGRGVAAGATVDGLASQVDIVPTVLGLAGVTGYTGPGKDWSTQVRAGGRTDRTRAFTDTDYQNSDKAAVHTEDRACEINYRFEEPVVSCWDRRTDPYYHQPLPTPDAPLVAELQAWRAGQDAEAAAWPWPSDAFPSLEEGEMLRELGYVTEEE